MIDARLMAKSCSLVRTYHFLPRLLDHTNTIRIGEEADTCNYDQADVVPSKWCLVHLSKSHAPSLIGVGDMCLHMSAKDSWHSAMMEDTYIDSLDISVGGVTNAMERQHQDV